MEFPFSKQLRLLKSEQYQAVFSNTDIKTSSNYILLLARRNSLPYSRLGLIVPKKKIKHAVGRNRVKRLLRDSFRLNQYDINGLDIIALVRANFGEIEDKLQLSHIQSLYQKLIEKNSRLDIE